MLHLCLRRYLQYRYQLQILELIYLLLGVLLISFHMDFFVLILLGITGCETAIGLSILLGYYIRS